MKRARPYELCNIYYRLACVEGYVPTVLHILGFSNDDLMNTMTSICPSKLDRLQTTKMCRLICNHSIRSLLGMNALQWLTDPLKQSKFYYGA